MADAPTLETGLDLSQQRILVDFPLFLLSHFSPDQVVVVFLCLFEFPEARKAPISVRFFLQASNSFLFSCDALLSCLGV